MKNYCCFITRITVFPATTTVIPAKAGIKSFDKFGMNGIQIQNRFMRCNSPN